MEVSTEKSKIITKSRNSISADTSRNGQQLEEMTSFKYLQAILCRDGTCSSSVIRIRIASSMAAMTRPNRIWRSNIISCASRFKSCKCFVTSIHRCGDTSRF